MKLWKIYPIGLLLLIVLVSSCSIINQGSGYDASPVFAPHHEKAGEVKTSAGYGGMLGVQGNISYALSNRVAVMAGGVYNHQNTRSIIIGIFSTQNYKLKNHYFEGALGYYLPTLGKLFTSIEISAGLGKGKVDKKNSFNRDFSDYYDEAKGDYLKPFVQVSVKLPAENISTDLYFVLANRLSYIHFQKLTLNDYSTWKEAVYNFNSSHTIVTEPVIMVNYGKRLKFTGQIGLAIPLTASLKTDTETYANASGIFQLGLQYQIKQPAF